ncbi:hypothetical protein K504DRAFT_424646 [Pleomassaria siparia CBS 279.74]|uniref:SP-RING-type domain-containing protein n=1 Tax=Pleomassaria siparia CBS 279.74 TaxID=1314801 RepID=A0A6G1KLS0_9PLEO|nr:hypothetical protein K504DRAFT_424646 [Pleomassaria siparia CBS 279.74]
MASRNRYATAQPTPGRQSMVPTQSREALQGKLPEYKKPSHPLSETAQRKITAIYDQRTLSMLKGHHNRAATLVTEAVGSVNDRVRYSQEYIGRRQRKWDKGNNLETREADEKKAADLKEKAEELTERLEASMRQMIDGETSAQRTYDSLQWVSEHGSRQMRQEYDAQMSQRQSQSQRRRRTQDGDGDGDGDEQEEEEASPGPTPLDGSRVALTGPWEFYADRQKKEKDKHVSISHYTRYAKNNDYIGFKQMAHDARYGDDGPTMPRPETWFTERGSPAPGVTATQNGNDSDDDIVLDKATVSTKCPLTLQRFRDPVTSSKCPHSFEKGPIVDMIRTSTATLSGGVRGHGVKCVQCPVPGCDQNLTLADLKTDAILLRKLKRMQEAEKRADAESDGSDDEGVAVPRSQVSQRISSSDVEEEEEVEAPAANTARHKREEMSSVPMLSSQIIDMGDPSEDEDEDEDMDE